MFQFTAYFEDSLPKRFNYNPEEIFVPKSENKPTRRVKSVTDYNNKSEENEKISPRKELEKNEFEHLKVPDFCGTNLELSQKFINLILNQVDELCENIKNGDPVIERTLQVNKNLNDAVSCYRSIFDLQNDSMIDPLHEKDCATNKLNSDLDEESFDCDTKDSDYFSKIETNEFDVRQLNSYDQDDLKTDINPYVPEYNSDHSFKRKKTNLLKINDVIDTDSDYNPQKLNKEKSNVTTKKIKKKKYYVAKTPEEKSVRLNRRDPVIAEKMKLVKNQCGKHSLASMSLMLNLNNSTLHETVKRDGITFSEKLNFECHMCEIKRSNENISKDLLFPYLKFNPDAKNNSFLCSICKFSNEKRSNVFTHIKSIHKAEITPKFLDEKIVEEKIDCEKLVCKKFYGLQEGKKFWCKKCIDNEKLPKEKTPIRPKIIKPLTLCPECGESVKDLKEHLKIRHGEKQICPHCAKALPHFGSLKQHIKNVHEKVPCTKCGKLLTSKKMSDHMQSFHMSDNQKNYKCDTCGKGFGTRRSFEEHKNIHTGEKPFKCKFCSASFASSGNKAMHQRIHLGHHRKSKK